ncbi:MAG: c-type cytochrome [Arenicella sp.]
MKIDVYIDGSAQPIKTIQPPEKFQLDSTELIDGPHQLIFKAVDDGVDVSTKLINFTVQNGPTIVVHGIDDDDILSGNIALLANAYGAEIGDEFEPVRMETPRPVPTWAWVLFLIVLGWAAGYISLAVSGKITMGNSGVDTIAIVDVTNTKPIAAESDTNNDTKSGAESQGIPNDWVALGQQIYGNNCSSCHQANGMGLPNVFPPLKGNPAVLDDDPSLHIQAVLEGVSNKTIEGVLYASPMPGFATTLSDEEIAAVVNHERSNWGNQAPLVTADDVKKMRN